jgi:hypothetical protein
MRNGRGSWAFIGSFVGFMVAWAIINTTGIRWDPYPFILLNLLLSLLAGLQGAILLIAAKRQDAIATALAQPDFETNSPRRRRSSSSWRSTSTRSDTPSTSECRWDGSVQVGPSGFNSVVSVSRPSRRDSAGDAVLKGRSIT